MLSDEDVVPEGRMKVLADALKRRPIGLEDLSKDSAARANKLGRHPGPGALILSLLTIACSIRTGVSSNVLGAPHSSPTVPTLRRAQDEGEG